jgi:hypothetical protein
MAKMFYTVEEAAAKLKKSADEVRAMAQSGQLQEFRDRDKLVFKKEQVDLLAGGDDVIALADSGEIPLASDDSGSGAPAATGGATKEKSGISIFEADETDDSDPLAATQITSGVGGGFQTDAGASGSGLLGMTQEADDTSLGAGLLDDVYGGKGAPAGGGGEGGADMGGGGEAGGGALFEPAGLGDTGAAAMAGAGAMAMVAAEPYDGAGSGLVGGFALGMVLVLGVMVFCTVLAIMAVPGAGLIGLFASNLWMYVGIFAGVTLLLGGAGWALGRKG